MRRLPCCGFIALLTLLASPALLVAPAQACNDQYPSCIEPRVQDLQEPADADDAPAAAETETRPVHSAAPARQRKARRAVERAPSREPAVARPSDTLRASDRKLGTNPPWRLDEAPAAKPAPQRRSAQATTGASVSPAADIPVVLTPPPALTDDATTRSPIAEASEVNHIELAAAAAPVGVPEPADISWLHGLLAVAGGALIAGSAARLLLV